MAKPKPQYQPDDHFSKMISAILQKELHFQDFNNDPLVKSFFTIRNSLDKSLQNSGLYFNQEDLNAALLNPSSNEPNKYRYTHMQNAKEIEHFRLILQRRADQFRLNQQNLQDGTKVILTLPKPIIDTPSKYKLRKVQ